MVSILTHCLQEGMSLLSPGCRKRIFVIVIFIAIALPASLMAAAEPTIKIGVLANRGAEHCLMQWSPTAEYLTETLPGNRFEIVPIAFDHIVEEVEQGKVDFILVNSSLYVELEINHGIDRIATLKNKRLNGTYTTFGGVIFCLKSREDIKTTTDLKGKTFMAVDKKSFGGWYMARRELEEKGIDPASDFSSLQFGGTQDAVVYAILNGKVDAGTVRTDTLERMNLEGKIHIEDFRVIHEHGGGKVHLPFVHSTREYPEWPLSKLSHTPSALAEKVAVKLIEMPEDSAAAVSAQCSGWTIPLNYQSVRDCLKILKVPPYEHFGEITAQDVVKKYWPLIVLTLSLFMVMAAFITVYTRLIRRLRATGIILEKEVEGHKSTEKLLQAAKAEAETANKTKGKFLANMSHEIRTPMNAIIGMSHLCLGTELRPQQREYIENVHQSAQLLLGIINDILDFSKIEAGKLKIESIPFRLDDVLSNLSNMISLKAQEKGLEILFDIVPETPLHLVGDPLRLGQILLNLSGNSVKFTESGEVVIRIRPLHMDEKKVELEVMVKDTGIGMTPEQISTLFRSFSQADASTTRKFGGSGLGLAISKYLVEQMNGRIWVESDPGQGSRFYFSAVFGRADMTKQRAEADILADLENLKVLVVDDIASAREMFAATLGSFSFRVTCVDSGEAALETLENAPEDDPYRLVLMDYMMPGIDGIEASRRIKKSPRLADITTLIMVTAYGREDVMQQADEAGLEGFLTKPVTPSDLLDGIVDTFSRKGKSGKRSVSENKWNIKPLEAIGGAHVLLVEDNRINQRVAEELLTRAGLRVTIAGNGREAIKLAEQQDFDAILMDIQMPEMDGYEATRIITASTSARIPPIIAMTANAMTGDREKCLEAGMSDHVAKPIEPRILFETLVKWIPSRENAPVHAMSSQELPPAHDTVLPDRLEGIDLETGLRRTGDNRTLYMDILRHFISDHGNDDHRIAKTIAAGDMKSAHRLAHTLKGVAGGIGALALSESARVLEAALKQGPSGVSGPMMENLTRDLRQVVDGLQKSLPAPSSSPSEESPDSRPLQGDAVKVLLDSVRDLAEGMNPDAGKKAEELCQLLRDHGSQHVELAAGLARQADDLDFEEALATLDKLREALGGTTL